jgi:3-oxoadipate enol-lactonase
MGAEIAKLQADCQLGLAESVDIRRTDDRTTGPVDYSYAMEGSCLIHSISLITPRGSTLSIKACGKGPSLFLIHGFPLDHRMWIHQMEPLSNHFQVIAPELRGFGGSTVDSDYTLADLADDIEQVRTHLSNNQPIRLVGLSMGGYVCFEYWRKYGHHLHALVLANTKPSADDDAAKQGRLAMADKALKEGTWPAVAPMIDRLLPSTAKGTAVDSQMREMMQSASPQAVAAAQRAMAQRTDFTAQLPSIKTRTLVITGELDPIAPPAATKTWAGQIPDAKTVVLPGVGHMTPLESPQQFNEELTAFLLEAN